MDLSLNHKGLAVKAKADGYLIWSDHPIDGPTDVITVRAQSDRPTKASLLWNPKNGKDDDMVQMFFDIPGGNGFHNIDVIVSNQPQWDWHTSQFALALPAGANVTIEELQFRRWPFYERTVERWKSFWTFDGFRPYSINFLWGPLLAGNEPARAHLFDTLPPSAPSATRYMYAFLAMIALAAFIVGLKAWRRPLAFGWFLAACILVWIIFDIRMGAEIISYAVHDVKTYVLPKPADKTLRNYEDVYARIEAMLPDLKNHQKIALLVPMHEVYEPLMRYANYPRMVVTDPTTMTGATAWVTMDRTDMWVDDTKHLRQGHDPITSTVIAGPGHIAAKIDENNFLFVMP